MSISASHPVPNLFACAALSTLVAVATPAVAADASGQQQLVDKARLTWERFHTSPALSAELRDWFRVAKGILIVPQIVKGAAGVGGAGGSGVLLVRNEQSGEWSQPAFYTIGSASIGLQVGGAVSEAVVVVRTREGVEQFLKSRFKLGVDIKVAAGPVGGGTALAGITADLVGYALSKGLFAGTALDGAFIVVSDQSNRAYYGRPVTPAEILVTGSTNNPHSQDLRDAVSRGMKR